MKVEYQSTPSMAEEILFEYFSRSRRNYRIMIIYAIFGALLLAALYPEETQIQINHTLGVCLFGAIGTASGLCVALFSRFRARASIASKARAFPHNYFGPCTFSWDDTGIALASPLTSHQYSWQLVDDFLVQKVGVHFICRGNRLFSVPKSALTSQNLDDLRAIRERIIAERNES